MRIAVLSLGSRGDVQPQAALSVALAARGHDVRLISHGEYAELVAGRGVDFRPLSGDIRADFAGSDAGRRMAASGRNPVTAIRAMVDMTRRQAGEWGRQIRDLAQGVELLVPEMTSAYPGATLAESWGIPWVQVCLQPIWRTRDFPSPMAPPLPFKAPGVINRLHHDMVAQLMWQPFRALVNQSRREVADLGPWPLFGPFGRFRRERRPVLMAFSPHVVPPPPDWDSGITVTGYWYLDRATDWTPPPALAEFLAAGPPPVYVGFGSMGIDDAEATTAAILEAIRVTGCRAVVSAGWGGLSAGELPAGIFATGAVPHDWLFPQMAAVVHHGGAGTTAAALRAGVPSVLVPFMVDQFFWARRLRERGVAPRGIPHGRLTAAALATALGRALGDQALRARAAELGALIQAEDGLGRAVSVIEEVGRG
jgi:sterol 3beta-glucosyltransferase